MIRKKECNYKILSNCKVAKCFTLKKYYFVLQINTNQHYFRQRSLDLGPWVAFGQFENSYFFSEVPIDNGLNR